MYFMACLSISCLRQRHSLFLEILVPSIFLKGSGSLVFFTVRVLASGNAGTLQSAQVFSTLAEYAYTGSAVITIAIPFCLYEVMAFFIVVNPDFVTMRVSMLAAPILRSVLERLWAGELLSLKKISPPVVASRRVSVNPSIAI